VGAPRPQSANAADAGAGTALMRHYMSSRWRMFPWLVKANDVTGAMRLLHRAPGVLGDLVQQGDAHGIVVRARSFKRQVTAYGDRLGIDVEIVERNPQEKGFVPQPKRWRVEQTYGILILHRRLVRDYEHCPASSASRVYWAMTHVMARRLTGANTDAARALADDLRTQIGELQTRLRQAETHLERLAITRKTVTGLADRLPAGPPDLPEHPDYPRILAAFNDATGPLRAKDVCEALGHELLPKIIEGTRANLKRLVKLGILTEADTGSFTRTSSLGQAAPRQAAALVPSSPCRCPCTPTTAHPLGQQDSADLAAADFDAQPLCFSGQCVESPLRWTGLIRRGQLAVGLHRQPTRRRLSDQANDLGAFRFGDPTLAALTTQILQTVQTQAVETMQPAANRLGAAPQLIRDGRHRLSGPAQLNHPSPQHQITRRLTRSRQPMHHPLFALVTARPCP
jgi:transposase